MREIWALGGKIWADISLRVHSPLHHGDFFQGFFETAFLEFSKFPGVTVEEFPESLALTMFVLSKKFQEAL